MINAIRFGRTPPPIVLTSPLPPQLRRSICSLELRSRQATGFATAPDQNPKDEEMDESQNKTKETGLVDSILLIILVDDYAFFL